ncbi:hypothetical protein BDR04DRAFT_1163864 [Suillus decipiens]|nr:hypothetical protein BDR04DRAFT_1163864 [Suillus decipiens]
MHSSEFKSAANHIGKKAIVVGCGSSARDIAHDFCDHGVDITRYQRSSTFVISAKSAATMLGIMYKDDFPTELADTYNTSLPWAVVRRLCQRKVSAIAETADKAILSF